MLPEITETILKTRSPQGPHVRRSRGDRRLQSRLPGGRLLSPGQRQPRAGRRAISRPGARPLAPADQFPDKGA